MTAVGRWAPAPWGPSARLVLDRLGAPVIHVRSAPFEGCPDNRQGMMIRRSAERSLVLAGPRDVVLLPAEPDPAFVELLAGLGVGTDPRRVVVPAGDPDGPFLPRLLADAHARARVAALLPGRGSAWLAPIAVGADDPPLAAAIAAARGAPVRVLAGEPAMVAQVSRKDVVREAALALGVPVAEGTVVRLETDAEGRPVSLAPLERAIRKVARRTGKAIVRGALGSSGSSLAVVGRGESFDPQAPQAVYLVEEHLAVLASPNVQVFIHPGTGAPTCVSVADQLLTAALGYRGNLYPSTADTVPAMVEASLRMARWLAGRGYRGLLGLDFIEVADESGVPRPLLAEINPRMNGSCAMMAMLERLNRVRAAEGRKPVAAAAGGVISTRARSFGALMRDLGARRYDPASGAGVLPFHTAGLAEGQCGLAAFADSREDALRLFESAGAEGKDGTRAG